MRDLNSTRPTNKGSHTNAGDTMGGSSTSARRDGRADGGDTSAKQLSKGVPADGKQKNGHIRWDDLPTYSDPPPGIH